MLEALMNGVLPVFGVLALGFAVGKRKVFDVAMAVAINRFVVLVALPILVFRLLARAPFHEFDWMLLIAFLISELLVYGTGFLLARKVFNCDVRESILLGMASAFANHLLFVLPIAILLFGEQASLPIVAIASVDAVVVYCGTVMILDATGLQGVSLMRLLRQFAKNPAILAIFIGLLVGLSGIPLPKSVDAFTGFAGLTAAPCALFALGIILSQQSNPGTQVLPVSISALKLLGHPLIAWFLIEYGFLIGSEWGRPAMMVAAGPSGALAFVLGLQYQVRIAAIARAVLYTSVGSLATVALFASMV